LSVQPRPREGVQKRAATIANSVDEERAERYEQTTAIGGPSAVFAAGLVAGCSIVSLLFAADGAVIEYFRCFHGRLFSRYNLSSSSSLLSTITATRIMGTNDVMC
jgi:hypothetical protein